MKFIIKNFPDLLIIEPTILGDDRGYFIESFNKKEYEKYIGNVDFVQDNESKSSRGVLRGLHFQKPPYDQAKLVRCIDGEVLDVAVDLRKDSPTYKEHISIKLSGDNKRQVFIPRGFAHGFVVLSETATFAYKVDNLYSPEHDSGIAWNDEEIAVYWEIFADEIKLSDKDKKLKPLAETENPF